MENLTYTPNTPKEIDAETYSEINCMLCAAYSTIIHMSAGFNDRDKMCFYCAHLPMDADKCDLPQNQPCNFEWKYESDLNKLLDKLSREAPKKCTRMQEKMTVPDNEIVTECCSNCGSEITMEWDISTRGYKAFCPVCGERLMLCSECLYDGNDHCDYDSEKDTCKHNSYTPEEAGKSLQHILKKLSKSFEAEALIPCSCGAIPEIVRVGDRKDLFAYQCPKCGKRLARTFEARKTDKGARQVWNMHRKEHDENA